MSSVLFVLPGEARALSYVQYRLFELAGSADLVVTGTIRSVDFDRWLYVLREKPSGTFELEIEEQIVGTEPDWRITVSCFVTWTCASRGEKYAPGQRVLLFLRKPKDVSAPYYILGAGCEGEMPLVDRAVSVRGYSIDGYTTEEPEVDGYRARKTLVPLAEFAEAVRAFRETYAIELDPRSVRMRTIRPKHSLKQAEDFAATSKTAKHLHHEASTSRAWKQ